MAHALIFGASGISGWALAKECLTYPSKDTFTHVTGLTNRPYTIENARLPKDERLNLVSGIDLTKPTQDVVKALKEKVQHLDSVSHVFFAAYIDPGTGYDALRDVNTQILKTAMEAVLKVTDKLKVVILQTGGKAYGVEFPNEIDIQTPLKDTAPRIKKPEYDSIFYYTQCDTLAEMSKGSSWTWTEVRPDVIIGFVPGSNFMNCAQGLGLYLSLYREIHGEGASVTFLGTHKSWKCKHSDSFQDIIARFEIHAALDPKQAGDGKAFNIADGHVVTWADKWPGICEYFGLKAEGPGDYEPLDQFAKKNAKVWDGLVKKQGLQEGRLEAYQWGFLDFVMGKFDFDRQYDLSSARSIGFSEELNTVAGYTTAFDRMREAKVIP